MEKCCISSCPKPTNLASYNIPTDAKRRNQWLCNINRDQNPPVISDQDTGVVCSLHFKQNDYIYFLGDNGTSERKISEDAVPSVFPWTFDWSSNYAAEMEVSQPSKKPSQQSGSQTLNLNAGLPEGETVQLGSVESLGITIHSVADEDAYLGSSANCLDRRLSTKNTKNFSVNPKRSKSLSQQLSKSTSTSGVETSENEDTKYFDILTQIHYSCSGCEFKSKDIISLKEHRMKIHPQIKSECPDINRTSVSRKMDTKFSSKPLVQVLRYPEKEKRDISSSSKKGQRESSGNFNSVHQHISKTHSASEASAVSDSQSSSSSTDLSSSSLSKTNGEQLSKRPVRNCYPCSQCSFRTPNARKLEGHVKETHPLTTDTSSEQSTRRAARQTDESLASDVALSDFTSSYLKRRLIKGHYYFLCPDTNCTFQAKDPQAILHHCRANHPSSVAINDRQTSKITDSGRNDRYPCGLCNFSTPNRQRKKDHELRHTEISGYRCSMCTYSVPTKHRLTFHVANHHSDGLSGDLYHFKAKTMTEKSSHRATAHKTPNARKRFSSEQPSNTDCDLEHVCSRCSFRTSSRDRFQMHEKTHIPDTAGSSTEEFDVVEDTLKKATRKMKRKREDREFGSNVLNPKLIERLVYHCPHCSFWARTVSCFHQHLMTHVKTPTFKCSHCDFSAHYRVAITRHIKKSPKGTHRSACWVMTKSVPNNQYPEFLKKSLVPELEYSGTSRIHTVGGNERLKKEVPVNSTDVSWEFSSVSSLEDNSDEGSCEWLPSSSFSSANMTDGSSSSPSLKITSDSSSEDDESPSLPNTLLSSDSKSKTKNLNSTKNTPSTDKSSSTLTSGIVLRSSNSSKSSLRKKLRIKSDEETDNHRPSKTHANSPRNDIGKGKRKISIPDLKDGTTMQLQILSNCLESSFPVLDEARAKRDAKEQMIREAQNRINGMRNEQLKMVEADSVSQSELLKLKERKNFVKKQLMIFHGEKIEAELQLRTRQCQELKLSIAMYEPGQESETNRNVLVESKNLVAESEAKLTEIKEAIANLHEEHEILESQIKENEDSLAGAAQLLEILQCELSEKETQLDLLQEELARILSDITQLVAKERTLIVSRTATCEEELKRLYEKGLCIIREKEREFLSALAGYKMDKKGSPNVGKSV